MTETEFWFSSPKRLYNLINSYNAINAPAEKKDTKPKNIFEPKKGKDIMEYYADDVMSIF